MKLTVNSTTSLSEAIGVLRQTFKDRKFFQVTINTGKARSISQNSILHSWFTQVAVEERMHSDMGVKCLCKLHIFLPILRGEDEEFNSVCEKVIDPLPYESKIKAMEILPVTSLMKTKQLARGLEAMQVHYAGRVELLFPDDE